MECSKTPLGQYALLVIKRSKVAFNNHAREHSAPRVFWNAPFLTV